MTDTVLGLGLKVARSTYENYPEMRAHVEEQGRWAFKDKYGFAFTSQHWVFSDAYETEVAGEVVTIPALAMLMTEGLAGVVGARRVESIAPADGLAGADVVSADQAQGSLAGETPDP